MNLFGQAIDPEVPPQGDEKTYALIADILGILCTFIGPLVIYLIKKDSPFAGKAALHATAFAGGLLALQVVMVILMIAVSMIPYIGFISCFIYLGVLLVSLYGLIALIIAAINANNGKLTLFPVTSGFIK